jgi:hypothetical protein
VRLLACDCASLSISLAVFVRASLTLWVLLQLSTARREANRLFMEINRLSGHQLPSELVSHVRVDHDRIDFFGELERRCVRYLPAS